MSIVFSSGRTLYKGAILCMLGVVLASGLLMQESFVEPVAEGGGGDILKNVQVDGVCLAVASAAGYALYQCVFCCVKDLLVPKGGGNDLSLSRSAAGTRASSRLAEKVREALCLAIDFSVSVAIIHAIVIFPLIIVISSMGWEQLVFPSQTVQILILLLTTVIAFLVNALSFYVLAVGRNPSILGGAMALSIPLSLLLDLLYPLADKNPHSKSDSDSGNPTNPTEISTLVLTPFKILGHVFICTSFYYFYVAEDDETSDSLDGHDGIGITEEIHPPITIANKSKTTEGTPSNKMLSSAGGGSNKSEIITPADFSMAANSPPVDKSTTKYGASSTSSQQIRRPP